MDFLIHLWLYLLLFLKEGDLVVYTEGRAPDSKMNLTTSPENFVRNNPEENNFLKDLPSDIKDTTYVLFLSIMDLHQLQKLLQARFRTINVH